MNTTFKKSKKPKRLFFSLIILLLSCVFSNSLFAFYSLSTNNKYYIEAYHYNTDAIIKKDSSQYDYRFDTNDRNNGINYNYFTPVVRYTVTEVDQNNNDSKPFYMFFSDYTGYGNPKLEGTASTGYGSSTVRLYYYYHSASGNDKHGFILPELNSYNIIYPSYYGYSRSPLALKFDTKLSLGDYIEVGYFIDNGVSLINNSLNSSYYNYFVMYADYFASTYVYFRYGETGSNDENSEVNKVILMNNQKDATALPYIYQYYFYGSYIDKIEENTNYSFNLNYKQFNMDKFFNSSKDWVNIMDINVASDSQTQKDYVIGLKVHSANNFNLVSNNYYWGNTFNVPYSLEITNSNSSFYNRRNDLPYNRFNNYYYLFGINKEGKTAQIWIRNKNGYGTSKRKQVVNDIYRDYIYIEFITDVDSIW